jgi:predicted nucleic acid-binding Zn ribbon protein
MKLFKLDPLIFDAIDNMRGRDESRLAFVTTAVLEELKQRGLIVLLPKRSCVECGKRILPLHANKQYCSAVCRNRAMRQRRRTQMKKSA